MLLQLQQPLVSGILMGGVYGLIAFGLSIVFGVMRVCNFAHGDFLMIAMYLSVLFSKLLRLDPLQSMIFIGVILFILGFYLQKVFVTPILKSEIDREPIRILLFTAGLSIFLQNIALMFMGGAPEGVTTSYSTSTFGWGSVIVSVPRLMAFGLSIGITLALWIFIIKTDTGRAMRAVSQDRQVAKLMGVNEYWMFALAFGIGAALLGLSGGMISTFLYVFPTMGSSFTLRSFVIVALGGIGSIPGALIGGVIIGVIESISAQFMPASYSEVVVFIIFILILTIKPSGIFGLEKQ